MNAPDTPSMLSVGEHPLLARTAGGSFLRTPVVERMGYRPASPRNLELRAAWPKLYELLTRLNVPRPHAADNGLGTRPKCGTVFDQNRTGSCTNQSAMKAIRITLTTKGIPLPGGAQDLSPKIGYGQTRQIERALSIYPGAGMPALVDEGAEPDDCITAAAKLGVAPMQALVSGYYNDVDPSNVNDEIVLADEEKTVLAPGAHDIDIRSTSRIAEWQGAINAGIGMTAALFVDTQNFMGWDPNKGPITKIDLSDPQGGGHQICGPCYWYTMNSVGLVWGFLNSWGNWGKAGFAEITDACLMTTLDSSIAYDVELLAQPSAKIVEVA